MSKRRTSINNSQTFLQTVTRSQSQKVQKNNVDKDSSQKKITDFDSMASNQHAKASEQTSKTAPKVSTPESSAPIPATSADIMKILQTLESMKEDNSAIKTQLKEMNDTWQSKINEIDTKLSNLSSSTTTLITENKTEIENLHHTVTDIEKSLNFQEEQIEEQKKELKQMKDSQEAQEKILDQLKSRESEMKKEVQKLQEKNLDMERHVRKYNLLLYGITENKGENIYRVIKNFFKEDLKIHPELVDSMQFANAHRLPSKGTGPKPIIVRFVKWTDRDTVLGQVYTGALPRGKRILTDLPPTLKAERHRLMQVAYSLRNCENPLKTRIIESGNTVRLQVRKNATDPWKNHTE